MAMALTAAVTSPVAITLGNFLARRSAKEKLAIDENTHQINLLKTETESYFQEYKLNQEVLFRSSDLFLREVRTLTEDASTLLTVLDLAKTDRPPTPDQVYDAICAARRIILSCPAKGDFYEKLVIKIERSISVLLGNGSEEDLKEISSLREDIWILRNKTKMGILADLGSKTADR
ncbi:hypothetical protein [Limimaricola sp. AA108-03]|uniref:hypothetical protein n=1 Tax=Limimaricola sp. AA108-03 TaxID=3425945 RepID=UPI003D77B992